MTIRRRRLWLAALAAGAWLAVVGTLVMTHESDASRVVPKVKLGVTWLEQNPIDEIAATSFIPYLVEVANNEGGHDYEMIWRLNDGSYICVVFREGKVIGARAVWPGVASIAHWLLQDSAGWLLP